MDVYLIRHAHAGNRGDGSHDRYRPLSDKGWRRAAELAQILSEVEIDRILTSPATRCSQTVEPLADYLGLEIEEDEGLWEGADINDALEILDKLARAGGVACSHGDIIPEVIDRLSRRGVPVRGRGCEKGSVWVLSHDGTDFTAASYISKRAVELTLT